MKVEENVKMVASEVPILFSLAAEKFIEEFTLRAWMHTEESKRKILQATDIAKAAKTTSMYDFLMYILPDEEAGLVRRSKNENNAIDTSEESEED
ncbi:unnamed protein product [Medioppia subpectinata]|uniref:Transcription factor CBF/NF-Y/archaeal histone domain-containing protein n=1 Tax=Medioppia subpectinata TaxID=1979941 RepID=A0A7R9KHS2_9ACAR|nr:unnamed protein product [Medioppia subpectinata]CAG2102799.1 unnamed protein product [Medioppia subpectinata]